MCGATSIVHETYSNCQVLPSPAAFGSRTVSLIVDDEIAAGFDKQSESQIVANVVLMQKKADLISAAIMWMLTMSSVDPITAKPKRATTRSALAP
jgi:hypothetical protein